MEIRMEMAEIWWRFMTVHRSWGRRRTNAKKSPTPEEKSPWKWFSSAQTHKRKCPAADASKASNEKREENWGRKILSLWFSFARHFPIKDFPILLRLNEKRFSLHVRFTLQGNIFRGNCHTLSLKFPIQDSHFSHQTDFHLNFPLHHNLWLNSSRRNSSLLMKISIFFNKFDFPKTFLTLQEFFLCLLFCYARSKRADVDNRLWMTEVEKDFVNLGSFFLCAERARRENGRDIFGISLSPPTVIRWLHVCETLSGRQKVEKVHAKSISKQ